MELTPLAGVAATVIEPSTDFSQADGTTFEDRSVSAELPSAEARFTTGHVAKAGLVARSAAMADKAKPIRKTWETSSSS